MSQIYMDIYDYFMYWSAIHIYINESYLSKANTCIQDFNEYYDPDPGLELISLSNLGECFKPVIHC